MTKITKEKAIELLQILTDFDESIRESRREARREAREARAFHADLRAGDARLAQLGQETGNLIHRVDAVAHRVEAFARQVEAKNQKVHCNHCNHDYKLNYWEKHIITKKHVKNVRLRGG